MYFNFGFKPAINAATVIHRAIPQPRGMERLHKLRDALLQEEKVRFWFIKIRCCGVIFLEYL